MSAALWVCVKLSLSLVKVQYQLAIVVIETEKLAFLILTCRLEVVHHKMSADLNTK